MKADFSTSFLRGDFPFAGRHLVEASAGTGKTYNIANLFVRLLAENADWRISQILVVTFTDAATKELRARLRDLLCKVQRELRAPGTGGRQAAELVGTLADADARRRAATSVDLALIEFDRASISTIHGFCGRALQRYAFESGLAFDADPPSEVKSAQLARAARDWWRAHVALRRDPALEPLLSDPDARGVFTLDALLGILRGIQEHADIRPAPSAAGPAGEAALADEARRVLLGVAFDLLERWNAERAARKEPDFGDVLLGLREALRPERPSAPALVAALREEYRAVLIDEFQDTDPVQYEIFRRAFLDGNPGIPVFFVGDPKQAIYAFRGGDIQTYTTAARDVPEDRRYDLSENRRSAPGVMAAVNALFRDDPAAREPFAFGDAGLIRYEKDVVAAGGKHDIVPMPELYGPADRAVQFVAIPDGRDATDVCADEICALLEKAPELVEEVTNPDGSTRIERRPLGPGDVAVLVRLGIDRTARALSRKLAARGVRAVSLDKKQSVFREPEAEAFRLLLAAIASPSSAGVVRAALLTPFFGLQAAEVDALAAPEGGTEESCRMTEYLRLFRELSDATRERGFLAAFDRLAGKTGFPARVAATGNRGERALTNLLHLAELVHAGMGGTGCNPPALLDWFVRKAGAEAGDAAVLRLESDGGAVRIFTVHSSKGLEFPVVFLLGADASIPPGGDGVLVHHDAAGALLASPATDGDALEQCGREAVEEGMRLLYVGVTRAAWRCHVIHRADEGSRSEDFNALFARAVRHPEEVLCRETPVAPSADWRFRSSGAGSALRAPPPPPSLPSGFGRGSFSWLTPASHAPRGGVDAALDARDRDAVSEEEVAAVPVADAPEGETSDHPIFSFPGGPNVGDCWHDILEEADFRAPAAALRPLVEKHLLAGGFLRGSPEVRDARTDTVLDMVGRTLDLPLTAPDGTVFRLRDVAREDRVSEWQFDFSSRDCAATTAALRDVLAKHWGGEPEGSDHRVFLDSLGGWNKPIPRGFFTGFLDLAFRVGGRYYVVDWKSNSLRRREAAFSHAGLRAEMTAHAYFLQYLIYAAVLHRHLADSLPDYRWETHFGGVRYVFLRGAAIGREAVWSDRPSEALLEDFGAALGLPRKGAHA